MNKYAISGGIGTLITISGFSIGLQFSPALGNILLFPLILASKILDIGFGEMNPLLLGILFLLTILFWGYITYLIIQRIQHKRKEKKKI